MTRTLSLLPVALAVVLALGAPATASANFELVNFFGDAGQGPNAEGRIADNPGGIATNDASGNVYEADAARARVYRFDSEGHFLASWGWGVGDGAEEYERCGPGGELAHPVCEGVEGTEGKGVIGNGAGQFFAPQSVAVDQGTGDVYVADELRGSNVIQVFSASGEYLAGFGERGSTGAQQIQSSEHTDGLAIGPTGTVYLIDSGEVLGPRVMVFEEEIPGDASSYAYKRQLFGPSEGDYVHSARQIALDAAGDLYLARENLILKFAAGSFSAPAWTVAKPEVEGLTTEPLTGAVFYYAHKPKRYFQLDAQGNEVVGASFLGATGQGSAEGSSFNPNVVIGEHPAGAFYGDTDLNPATSTPAKIMIFAGQVSHVPLLAGLNVSAVGAGVATLSGEVNPQGAETRYVFRYGTEPCATSACAEAPLGGVDIGNGSSLQRVSETVGGLLPDTTYHFILTASNPSGSAEEIGEGTFRTFPATDSSLPDGRAWELVSPIDKHGGEVFPINAQGGSCINCEPGEHNNSMPMESSPDGNSVIYEGYPFTSSGGAVDENAYLATRSSTGWRTQDLSPELLGREARGYRAFSQDFGSGLLAQTEPVLAPGAPAGGFQDLYVQGPGGSLIPLLTAVPPHRGAHGESSFVFEFAGASSDLRHVVVEANDVLTEATPFAPAALDGGAKKMNLYEWTGAAGQLRLVNVLPGNTTTVPGAGLGSGKEFGGTEAAPNASHAISPDGSRIFWSNEATGQVYVRLDGESTAEIPDAGRFLTASVDGGKVLLNDGHIYDLESHALSDVTAGIGGFQGILGASEDLGRVYFVDTAVLPGVHANGFGASAEAGKDNLYLYDAAQGSSNYIATLATGDENFGVDGLTGDWVAAPSNRTAQVSGDGRFAAFMSVAPLSGFDNRAASGGVCESGTSCFEVFEFDAESGRLSCASCNSAGIRPVGDSRLSLIAPVGSRYRQPHNLAADGRLFFDSFDVLSAQDVRPGIENVYEYEQAGQGSCTRAGGCIALISSGHSPFDASFFDATPSSGHDVFLTTREKLITEDGDELVDLYDAREGGGFTTPAQPTPCVAEGCKLPASQTPQFPAAGSTLLSSPLGPPPSTAPASKPKPKPHKCPKKKVRRHGKCVKAKPSKKRKGHGAAHGAPRRP